MTSPMKLVSTCILLLLALPAAAQYEDEQTRDHERQDRRYYQRHVKQEQTPQDATDPDGQAAAFFARADELIRDKNYDGARSRTFWVQTDDPRIDPDAVATLLEGFRVHFDRFWKDRLELKDDELPSRVMLFYSFHKFNQLLAVDFRRSDLRPTGHYRADLDAITLHTDPSGGSELAETLVHEAAHQLVSRRLVRQGRLSLWLSEGLASYFGYTRRDQDGTFRTGEIGGKSIALSRGGRPQSAGIAKRRLVALRRAARTKSDDGGPFSRVVEIRNPGQFYGDETLLNYAASWILVHYLFHAEDSVYADDFARYLELEREGQGGAAAFYETLKLTPVELDTALATYAKRLKTR